MKTLSELQIIAEGKYPLQTAMGGYNAFIIQQREAYIQGCIDTQEEIQKEWMKEVVDCPHCDGTGKRRVPRYEEYRQCEFCEGDQQMTRERASTWFEWIKSQKSNPPKDK